MLRNCRPLTCSNCAQTNLTLQKENYFIILQAAKGVGPGSLKASKSVLLKQACRYQRYRWEAGGGGEGGGGVGWGGRYNIDFATGKLTYVLAATKVKWSFKNVLLQLQMCSAANMNVKLIPIATAAAFQL